MTFWDHLEVFRKLLFRLLAIIVTTAVVTFCLKEPLFKIILAPSKPDFVLYHLVNRIAAQLNFDASILTQFNIELFSATLTSQLMIHLKIAFYAGIIVAMPYILYELYSFISPALRLNEKRYTTTIVIWSYVLFMMGILLNYFLIFPLAFRFLGTYQVSADVPNIITLASYSDMLTTLTLLMGILFELPILSWFLAKLGLINAGFMKHYRKHAFVAILIVGAVITPTTDIFTLLLIAAPIYLLYEASIKIVKRCSSSRNQEE